MPQLYSPSSNTSGNIPGRVVQSIKCLPTNASLRSRGPELDPGPVPYFCGD